MTSSKFVRHLTLAKNIVVLDGLTGTGKTMFSPLLASMEKMQNPRFEYMFEYLLIAAKQARINEDAANTLIRLLTDIKLYDGSISRDVNFRPSDLSGVFANKNGFKYLKQLLAQDGNDAQAKIELESPKLLLVTHQIFSCLDVLNNCFGDSVKIVEMVRHPLYLIDHWLSYIDMHCVNPRDFTLWLQSNDQTIVPWFAEGWEEQYQKMTSIERVVKSIDVLMQPIYKAIKNSQKNFLIIPFEDFVLKPFPHLKRLEVFLGSSLTPGSNFILEKQNVPRHFISNGPLKKIYARYNFTGRNTGQTDRDEYEDKFTKLKEKYGLSVYNQVLNMSEEYHSRFGHWF